VIVLVVSSQNLYFCITLVMVLPDPFRRMGARKYSGRLRVAIISNSY